MSSIFVFPGQGSQVVGMGKELYDNHPAARAVFDAVDDCLHQKLSEIIFNGPMEELTMTANVQPAIFAVSMAMLRIAAQNAQNTDNKFLIENSPFVAGHSLGEYTALCAANSLTISDTAKLLRLRGNAMQDAVPVGLGLTAVILWAAHCTDNKAEITDFDINKICHQAESETGGVCDVANDNAPGQVVISGEKNTVERAIELAKSAGAKRAIVLQMSAPVHCRLQEPTADKMRAALADTDLRAPIVPIISNKTAAPMTDPVAIKEALVYQITHGVRWRESVLAMPTIGITETIEVGPGAVLTGLSPRIVPEMTAKKLGV